MEDRDVQRELFDEFERGKRHLKMHRGHLTRPTYVSIPLERLVFISIGMIMALVIVHAIGVERGKTIARSEARKTSTRPQVKARPQEVTASQQAVLPKGMKTKYKAVP